MTDATPTGDRPTVGLNRPTVLFVVWLGIAVSITGLAVLDMVQRGFADAWIFLMAGLMLLWFMLRDWFRHDGGEFVTRNDDWLFLGMTVFVLATTVWVLLARFVV